MRERMTSDTRRRRGGRRAAIVAVIVAATTPTIAASNSWAGEPATIATSPIAPLPLSAAGPTIRVQGNPFCEPVLSLVENPNIRLASDSQVPMLRLKPIGVAVGLRNIGEPDSPLAPVITIDQVGPSPIQSNPLVTSLHHTNEDLAEVAVSDVVVKPLLEQVKDPALDTIQPILEAVQPVLEAVQPVLESAVPKIEMAEVPNEATEVPTEPSEENVADNDVAIEPEASVLEFSLSDNDANRLVDMSSGLAEATPILIELAEPLVAFDFAAAPPSLMPQTSQHQHSTRSSSIQTTSGYDSDNAVSSIVSSSNRYRPPVDVASTPLPIKRSESTDGIAIVRPAVTRVESIQLVDEPSPSTHFSDSNHQKPQTAPQIDLYMTMAQVRSLTMGGKVHKVTVSDQAICQVVTSGSNELKLIGTGRGVTRLSVWGEDGISSETKVQVFRIHVEGAVEVTGEAVGDTASTLNQSIARAFPSSRVRVSQRNGQLIVEGNCDSDKSASQIIRMVRKTCLIPVVDELVIR